MKPITVYLIDDNPAMLALLTEVIEQFGMVTKSYTRAKQFFTQVSSFEPDSIMVLDLLIPEIDGIEVMARLAKMNKPPALILISGRGTELLHSAEKLGRAYKLDILACLNKSGAIGDLRQLLGQYVADKKNK